MFSCCRANSKNSKKSKKSNEDNAKEHQEQKEISQQNDASSKSENKKLIIPTITIENGKTTTDNVFNYEQDNGNNKLVECLNNETDKLSEQITTTTVETETKSKSLEETETNKVQSTTTTSTIEAETTVADSTGTAEINVDSVSVSLPPNETLQSKNNYLENKNSSDDDVEAITNAVTPTRSPENINDTNNSSCQTNDRADSSSTTQSSRCDTNANTANNGKPKSCLSRHNSTHTSIKKRVNISVHTEIIEPDPLLTIILPMTCSIGDEEDDVFSDSVPPPKRESMCAPYLERDIDNDDVVSETLAYAHGLPEWFNDERINDV